LSEEEIESARRLLKRLLKRKTEVEVLIRSFFPRTKKPAEVRMGKGKGKISKYVSVVCPGQLFFRLRGVAKPQAQEAFLMLKKKLSIGIRFHDYDKFVGYKRVERAAQIKIK
jgi:large subunit ribosomal protein L16